MLSKFKVSLVMLSILSGQMVRAQALFQGLDQPVDARGWALGAALNGLAGGPSGITFNPALLTRSERLWQTTLTTYILDIRSTNLIAILPLAKNHGHVGFHIGYLNYSDFTETDEANNTLGTFSAGDLYLRLAYGYQISRRLSAGLSTTRAQSRIGDQQATAWLGSAGLLYYEPVSTIAVGLSYTNFGNMTAGFGGTREELRPLLMVGVSKKLAHLPMTLTGDLMHRAVANNTIKIGGEFNFRDTYFLRWGTSTRRFQIGSQETLTSFFGASSLGAGFRWRSFQLDLSTLSIGHAGQVTAISLTQKI